MPNYRSKGNHEPELPFMNWVLSDQTTKFGVNSNTPSGFHVYGLMGGVHG